MNDKIKIGGTLMGVAALGAAAFEGIKYGVKKGKTIIQKRKADKDVKADDEK